MLIFCFFNCSFRYFPIKAAKNARCNTYDNRSLYGRGKDNFRGCEVGGLTCGVWGHA